MTEKGEGDVTGKKGNGDSKGAPLAQSLIDSKTRTRVLWIVVTVWATNFFAGLVVPDYRPDPQVHAVFMIVAGAIFAADLGRRRSGGDSE